MVQCCRPKSSLLGTHLRWGFLDGIEALAREHCVAMVDVEQIIHGTTLATNALIERSGAKTALVTTKGFRDVIENPD